MSRRRQSPGRNPVAAMFRNGPLPGPRRRELTADEYVAGARAGDIAVLARTLTLIESSSPRHQALAEEVLTRFAAEPAAYIRPSPAAGTLGGVARKTREAMLVCEAAGYQVVLIETVGVGQSETVVADMTDCFLALMLPGAGDELQGIKRGLLELVDVIAVNKADGPTRLAAEQAAEQYRLALGSLAGQHGEPPAVLTCSALYQEGIETVWHAIQRRHSRLAASG